jgi:hypothetical protein
MESLRRRRARAGKPRPKMVRVYTRALVAKNVSRQQITKAVIEV